MKLVLTTIAFVMVATPAMAFQPEIDSQDVHHQKAMWLKWDWMVEGRVREHRLRLREQRREAALAEQAVQEADASSDTETPPDPPVAYSGGVLSANQVAAYARGAGFPESVISTMVAIAWRESGFCPSAVYGYGCNSGGTVHGSNACGLWQMYPCPGSHALDPATNAAMAYSKYQAAGLSPWGY